MVKYTSNRAYEIPKFLLFGLLCYERPDIVIATLFILKCKADENIGDFAIKSTSSVIGLVIGTYIIRGYTYYYLLAIGIICAVQIAQDAGTKNVLPTIAKEKMTTINNHIKIYEEQEFNNVNDEGF